MAKLKKLLCYIKDMAVDLILLAITILFSLYGYKGFKNKKIIWSPLILNYTSRGREAQFLGFFLMFLGGAVILLILWRLIGL